MSAGGLADGAGQGIGAQGLQPVAGASEGVDLGVVDDAVRRGRGDGLPAPSYASFGALVPHPVPRAGLCGQPADGALVVNHGQLFPSAHTINLE